MAKTKLTEQAKKVNQSSSDSSGSSDSSSDEAPATKVETPKQTVEKTTPKSKPKLASEEATPPKPVPADKYPKRRAESSSVSSDDEPPVKKTNNVEPTPIKPQPAVNIRARKNPCAYTRIPNTATYNGPAKSQDREWWGNNVKGKKFRKEKGKKKRSQYSGAKIDGSIKSFRLDSR